MMKKLSVSLSTKAWMHNVLSKNSRFTATLLQTAGLSGKNKTVCPAAVNS